MNRRRNPRRNQRNRVGFADADRSTDNRGQLQTMTFYRKSTMEQETNTNNKPTKRVRFADAALQDSPKSHADFCHLQDDFQSARKESFHLRAKVNRMSKQITALQAESTRSYETIKSYESQISDLKRHLRNSEDQGHTASKGKLGKVLSENKDLREKSKALEESVKETAEREQATQNQLREKVSENQVWQDRYNALEEKYRQELAKTEQVANSLTVEAVESKKWQDKHKALERQFREKMAENDQTIMSLKSQICDLNYSLQVQMEQMNAPQPGSRHVRHLIKKNDDLKRRLTSSEKYVVQILAENENRQEKYNALQERLSRETGEKDNAAQDHMTKLMLEKQDCQEKYKALQEKFREELAAKEQVTQNILKEKDSENQAWQNRYNALEEKFRQELANTEQVANLTMEKQDCLEKYKVLQEKFREELAAKEQVTQNILKEKDSENLAWQNRYSALEEKFRQELAKTEQVPKLMLENQSLQQTYRALQERFNKEMAEKCQVAQSYLKQLILENKDCRGKALQEKLREELATKDQTWQTRANQLEEEKRELAEKHSIMEEAASASNGIVMDSASNSIIEEMDSASHGCKVLMEATNQLSCNKAECLQNDKPQEKKCELKSCRKDRPKKTWSQKKHKWRIPAWK